MIDAILLAILACPVCGGKLLYDQQDQQLVCQYNKLLFCIREGVPYIKVKDAQHILDGEV